MEAVDVARADAAIDDRLLGRGIVTELMVTGGMNLPLECDELSSTPAVLLVGGFGTRLKAVLPSTPKPLAQVGDMPFLELLVLQLRSQGIRRLVMCTGYLADQVESQFGDGNRWDVVIDYSRETQPLGTAGAVKFAERHLGESTEFFVMNGDSFLEMNLKRFAHFHRDHKGLATMAVRKVTDAARYGTVQLDPQGRVNRFQEKTGAKSEGIINGGVYLFDRRLLHHIPDGPVSLERDVFPCLLDAGIYGLEQDGIFIDIGTPEDYTRAQEMCRSLQRAALAELQ